MDTPMQSGPTGSDNDDLPVPIESLAVDGTRPQVGDHVEVKVGGTISKIVNDNAWVTPATVNDQPIPDDADQDDSMDALQSASASAGSIGSGY